MSTTEWTNPVTEEKYKIGYEGLEHGREGLSGFILELFRKTYSSLPGQSIFGTLLFGGSLDAAVPTYGLWAGPGWNAGRRTPEGDTIDWDTLPCYNSSIKDIENNPELNPENCISLTDAICKAHDWRYSEADETYKDDSAGCENAKRSADIIMLQDIAVALSTGSFQEVVGSWEKKTYTNTFDSAEVNYLAKLVPLFYVKIAISATLNDALSDVSIAYTALKVMLPFIPIDGTVLQDPSDPTKKTVFHVVNDLMITQKESESSSDLCIVDMNGVVKPLYVNIAYGADSTKAEEIFVVGSEGAIRINGGSGDDEITISKANNDTTNNIMFELAGGGGYDSYFLQDGINYKITDSGENRIYKEKSSGGWFSIGNLYRDSNSAWISHDGSVTLTQGSSGTTIITFEDGSTVDLGTTFQSGDYGINLITQPTDPVATTGDNTILGDRTPVDFDTTLEGIQTQYDEWGNVIVDESQYSQNRADILYDTTASDKIESGGGSDIINIVYGNGDLILAGDGDDWINVTDGAGNILIDSGEGNDLVKCTGADNYRVWILGNDGDDLLDGDGADSCYIEGGNGSDIIFGSIKGGSQLFGDTALEMDFMIANGETAEDNGQRGDVVAVYWGDNYLYGSNGYDIMWGGIGKDLIVAGGGNDLIIGDGDNITAYWSSSYDWSFNIDINTDENGNTTYAPLITGSSLFYDNMKSTIADDDLIYAGSGNDYVDAGGGNDEVYGGTGVDTILLLVQACSLNRNVLLQ